VAVFVQDRLGVFGVVHAALSEAEQVMLVPRERIVDAELVDSDVL
jgi:hypothetical protein